MPLKLLVVEGSAAMRARILDLVRDMPPLQVVGVASTNAEAVARYEALDPDVVTLDVRLEDGSSLPALRWMLAAERPPVVVVITDHDLDAHDERFRGAPVIRALAKAEVDRLPLLLRSLAGGATDPGAEA